MKARKVKINPDAAFGETIEQILTVRFDEMDSFARAAQSPDEVDALHDMRIAAKRLRYALEVAAPALPDANARAKAARRLQDLLGDIHDCDELLPLVRGHVKRLREQDAAAAAAGEPLPNRRKYRGLEALRAHTVARRAALHGRFVSEWPKLRKRICGPTAVAA